MDISQIEQASSLLRRRDTLKKRINELDPHARSGLLQLSTSRPVLPTDGARHRISGGTFESGSEVAISGEALKIVTDLIGSLLSRQLEDVERQLADLGVTETMQATEAEQTKAEPEPEKAPREVELIMLGAVRCDCPTCQGTRA